MPTAPVFLEWLPIQVLTLAHAAYLIKKIQLFPFVVFFTILHSILLLETYAINTRKKTTRHLNKNNIIIELVNFHNT